MKSNSLFENTVWQERKARYHLVPFLKRFWYDAARDRTHDLPLTGRTLCNFKHYEYLAQFHVLLPHPLPHSDWTGVFCFPMVFATFANYILDATGTRNNSAQNDMGYNLCMLSPVTTNWFFVLSCLNWIWIHFYRSKQNSLYVLK